MQVLFALMRVLANVCCQLQAGLALAAAAAATTIYAALAGVFESVLRPYNIDASLGVSLFAVL